jgi:hypothetical protein
VTMKLSLTSSPTTSFSKTFKIYIALHPLMHSDNHDYNTMLYITWDISIYDVIEDSQLRHGMKILQWWEIRGLVRINWMRKKDHNWCKLRSTWDFLVTEFTNYHQLTTKIRIIDHVRKFWQFKMLADSTLQVLYKMYVTKESSDLTLQLKIRVVDIGSI